MLLKNLNMQKKGISDRGITGLSRSRRALVKCIAKENQCPHRISHIRIALDQVQYHRPTLNVSEYPNVSLKKTRSPFSHGIKKQSNTSHVSPKGGASFCVASCPKYEIHREEAVVELDSDAEEGKPNCPASFGNPQRMRSISHVKHDSVSDNRKKFLDRPTLHSLPYSGIGHRKRCASTFALPTVLNYPVQKPAVKPPVSSLDSLLPVYEPFSSTKVSNFNYSELSFHMITVFETEKQPDRSPTHISFKPSTRRSRKCFLVGHVDHIGQFHIQLEPWFLSDRSRREEDSLKEACAQSLDLINEVMRSCRTHAEVKGPP